MDNDNITAAFVAATMEEAIVPTSIPTAEAAPPSTQQRRRWNRNSKGGAASSSTSSSSSDEEEEDEYRTPPPPPSQNADVTDASGGTGDASGNTTSGSSGGTTTTTTTRKTRPFQHYEIFKAMRDVSVYADRGLISIGEFQYVRRAIFSKGERIRNPLMRHMFRVMIHNIITYAVANKTLPPHKLLKQWRTDFVFGLLPDGRTPPLHDDWACELRDANGQPPPNNKKREAKDDASYTVSVVVKPLRAKQYTMDDIPTYLELPRINFCNIAAAVDVSSLPYGLHNYVAQLIEHIGDEYARNEPFVHTHARYAVLRKSMDSSRFKHNEEYVRNVIEPRVHEQRSAEDMFVDMDANEEIPEGRAAATAFESNHRVEMTPYDRFYCKYYYGRQHADRIRDADNQIAEQARASLERARVQSEERTKKRLANRDARGAAMVKKALIEQQERDAKLGSTAATTSTETYYDALPPKSPGLTPEQMEVVAEATVANLRKQQQQQQRRGRTTVKAGRSKAAAAAAAAKEHATQ